MKKKPSLHAKAQQTEKNHFIAILKKTTGYNPTEKQMYPDFTYQSPADSNLTDLRLTYHLDSIAGNGSQVQRAIRLMKWFHDAVPHNDLEPWAELNAKNIISTYQKTKNAQGCYGLAISLNEIFLSMGFKSRIVILFSHNYEHTNGGHVISTLYVDSLKKWVYMDPQENAYVTDEKGNMLSIFEVRKRMIDSKLLVLSKDANFHGVPSTKQDYLYTFIAEHIYRMIYPLNSKFNSETVEPGKVMEYVELLPVNSGEPK